MTDTVIISPLTHIGEITKASNIAMHLVSSCKKQNLHIEEGDILVVTQKIVSKAEGQVVLLSEIEPSDKAIGFATEFKKDPRLIELIFRESKRIVRMDHGVIISETKQGFICANAGIDQSNVGNTDTATLLPSDPDASAKLIRSNLQELSGVQKVAVIISDTWGRPWREGQVNFAIGVAGMEAIRDYRGEKDSYGYTLSASVIGIADELAASAELVMGKVDKVPAAHIRGYAYQEKNTDAKTLLRNAKIDLFR